MTTYEMRERLSEYCDGRECKYCKLKERKCGRGISFLSREKDGEFKMTDAEIKDAYKIVLGYSPITEDEERSIATLTAGKKLIEAMEKDSLSSLMEVLEYVRELKED